MVLFAASNVNFPAAAVADTSYFSPKVLLSLIILTDLISAPSGPAGTYFSVTVPSGLISGVSDTGTLSFSLAVPAVFSAPSWEAARSREKRLLVKLNVPVWEL